MLFRFCLYGFLKNQRYFEPFMMLALLAKDLSFFAIGVLYACRWLTLNVLEVPSGMLADQWGRRKCMLVSFAAYIVSFLLFAFAASPILLAPAMVFFGIGDSFRTGTHKAMIFHWLRLQGRESERTKIYGFTRSWSKFGSALSAVIAAGLLLTTRSYQSIFLFAAIPCVLNIINFLGYPDALDEGELTQKQPENAVKLHWIAAIDPRRAMAHVWLNSRLRLLVQESMAWEGVFSAINDYLQPALMAWVFVHLAAGSAEQPPALSLDASHVEPSTVIVVSGVYTVLFVLSGWASQGAHRLVERRGAQQASYQLWVVSLMLYSLLMLSSFAEWHLVLILAFVMLAILQNVWRPILMGRIDEESSSAFGATVLSVESQAQRLTTMLLAPLIGWMFDWITHRGHNPFWVVGAVGILAAAGMLTLRARAEAKQDRAEIELRRTP